MTTQHLLTLWAEGRTRLTGILPTLGPDDLAKRLPPSPNSIGFLLRHVAEVELLFAKNVFGLADVKVVARTIIAGHDTGEWTDLPALLTLMEESEQTLRQAILAQPDDAWTQTITTKEFGTKNMAEALGRIATHTAYHAGQIQMIGRYGKP